MPTTPPPKSDLLGGIVLCVFPAIAFYLGYDKLVMPWPILFALFPLYGLWMVIASLFHLDSGGAMSWLVAAVGAAGFAVFVIWIAFTKKNFRGGIPFIPEAWNQNFIRGLFIVGGLLAALSAAVFLRKAIRMFRKRPDDGV
jgi:hypothetical protein